MFINLILPVMLFMCDGEIFHRYALLLAFTRVISLIEFNRIMDRSLPGAYAFPSFAESIKLFVFSLVISELFYKGKPYILAGFISSSRTWRFACFVRFINIRDLSTQDYRLLTYSI